MKKSYLALGAIAIALSSCSNDSLPGPSTPNQGGVDLEGAEDVIALTVGAPLTADASGSRTRGTGTVGSTDGTTGWQFEDLYVLMTTSYIRALEDGDITNAGTDDAAGWGFTSFCGVGPVLQRQFNGSFFARVNTNGSLDFTKDANQYWDRMPINRFYPLKGASDFFAYYIDDAAATWSTEQTLYPAYTGDGTDPNAAKYPTITNRYPVITKHDANYMTVGFTLDGTQDLLYGKAARVPGYKDGFSAKSARNGVIPNIQMQHMLSRLTFAIKKGKDKNTQVIGATGDEEEATFTKANKVTINYIKVTSEYKGTMLVAYDVDAYADAENTLRDELIDKKYVIAGAADSDPDTFQLAWAPATGELAVAPKTQFTLMNKATGTPALTTGKPKVSTPFTQPVSRIASPTSETASATGYCAPIGEAMFVKPGVDTYMVDVNYTFVVRPETSEGANDAITETKTVTLKLKAPTRAPSNGKFLQGYSYNAILTVYGLEPITAEVQLTQWADGGTVNVGQDGDTVNP